MIEKSNNTVSKDDFIQFVLALADDFRKHPETWENTNIPDFLCQAVNWLKDYSESPKNDIAWEKIDFRLLAKFLYMGKIYE